MTLETALGHADVAWIPQFRAAVRGAVVLPQDERYDEARALYITGYDRRPAAIVRPVDAADVARIVRFAREHDVELAVRGGGHSVAGHGGTEGGIMVDLGALRGLEIDAQSRTAWSGGGLTAGEYTRAVAVHGLATPFGDSATVGIGGITLGGGVGLLHRRHGLTIDNLLAAEVVTADGRIVQTDADRHPDLFWAIRGGGGNFGIVTRFRYRLVEVSEVVGGMLILPASPAVLASLLAEAEAAPEALSGVIAALRAPPMPFLPPEAHGRPIIMAFMVYDGPADAGERAFAPFRALAKPLADMIRPVRFPEVYDGPEGPHPSAMTLHSFYTDGFDSAAAGTVLEGLATSSAAMAVAQFRVLGGAVARVPADATAFAYRDRRIMAAVAALYDSREAAPRHDAWAADMVAQVRRAPGAYVNFIGDVGPERVREAYGAAWERLRAIKARYDPANLFRLNQNIPPATSA
jgi:FAD/FMN-containing dehydrogenase